jgi:putative Holliday junction resolvase
MIQQPQTLRKPSKWRDCQGLRYTFPLTKDAIFAMKESREGQPVQGRVLAIDIGSKRVGVAISDELRLSVRPLSALSRKPWKRLLNSLIELCERFDVRMVVLGLPLRLDGSEGDAAIEARRVARNIELSLKLPLFLQDERYTSKTAETSLREQGFQRYEISAYIDSEAASIILSDYLANQNSV